VGFAVVPAVKLRQKLLAMTTSGGEDDPAARCLNFIDELRDEYGAPEAEPRIQIWPRADRGQ
jgi:hypothetical protein